MCHLSDPNQPNLNQPILNATQVFDIRTWRTIQQLNDTTEYGPPGPDELTGAVGWLWVGLPASCCSYTLHRCVA